jgi:hypothetical protein
VPSPFKRRKKRIGDRHRLSVACLPFARTEFQVGLLGETVEQYTDLFRNKPGVLWRYLVPFKVV